MAYAREIYEKRNNKTTAIIKFMVSDNLKNKLDECINNGFVSVTLKNDFDI